MGKSKLILVEKETYCFHCKKPTDTLYDKKQKNTVCDECKGIKNIDARTLRQKKLELYGTVMIFTISFFAVFGFISAIYFLVKLFF